MSFGERVKETLITRAAEGLGLSVGVVLVWGCSELDPAMFPVLESSLSEPILLKIMLASVALNIILFAIFWVTRKKALNMEFIGIR
jgi:hypothetical protein